MNQSVTLEVEYEGVTFTVKGEWIAYRPGRYQGPPELCYPSEGGIIEELDILVNGDQSVYELLTDKAIDAIKFRAEDQCMSEFGG